MSCDTAKGVGWIFADSDSIKLIFLNNDFERSAFLLSVQRIE